MKKTAQVYVKNKQEEKHSSLTDEEKEDIGLLALMQEGDPTDIVPEEDIYKLFS